MLYPEIPKSVKEVRTVTVGKQEFKIVEDNNIPEGEIHFVDRGVCIGKIINICN